MQKTYEWSDSLCVGIATVDEQHKKLVVILGDIQNALFQKMEDREVIGHLRAMRDYAVEHFSLEEKLMSSYAKELPDYEHHLAEHRDFEQRTGDLFMRFVREGGELIAWKLFTFLGDWLVTHIQGTDRKMGVYLHSKGVH